MLYKKYATFIWCWFWGILTIIFAMTDNLILAILTFWILVGITTYPIASYYERKRRLKELFEVYPSKNTDNPIEKAVILKKDSIKLVVSPNPQPVKIMIRMKASVTIVFIALSFEGSGQRPEMKKPYDHQFNDPHLGAVYKPFLEGGGWNVTFEKLGYRNIGQRIRVGFDCIAPFVWNGNLKVHLTCEEEARKTYLLPFSVIEESIISPSVTLLINHEL